MLKELFSKKEENIIINNPLSGEIIDLKDVPDDIFSNKLIGEGFAIIPEDNKVYSPVNGVIKAILPTLHSVGIKSSEGLEILIHIGIDTVKLKGEGFFTDKKIGDKVEVNELLIEFDNELILNEDLCLVTPVVITNQELIESLNIDYGYKNSKEPVCDIKLK